MRLNRWLVGRWSAGVAVTVVLGMGAVSLASGNRNNNSNNNGNNTPQKPAQSPPASQPSRLSQDETAQNAAAAALKADQQKLQAISDAHWATFAQSPDWTAAQSKLTSAQSDLDSAKQAAQSNLDNNPDYQAALAAKKKAQDDLSAARASGDATPETLAPLATASLQATINLRKITSEVQANDTGVQSANDALAKAQHDSEMLKMKFQQSLLLDKQYVAEQSHVAAAQQAYDDAHQKVLSSSGGS